MKLLPNPSLTLFPFFTPYTSKHIFRPIKVSVSVQTPPPDFDFRNDIASESRAAIAKTYPELLDLADNGTLILLQKQSFGPVPAWRKEFVEPEAIWLVGTSHISPESASIVERVVRTVKPDNVAVELCRSRAGIMYTSSVGGEVDQNLKSGELSLTGTGFLGAVGRSLDLGGQTALALRLLLAVFSSKLSSVADRPFGDEFRAARKASEEVGAQLVLGDRPIEITLQRAWNSLKWGEKFNLVMAVTRVITSSSGISAAELKEQETDENSGSLQLYERLSFSYPALLMPLIHERDTYLAWSLKRSKAVNGCKTVVGVIGKGHMNGVIYALVSDSGDLRFRDLVGRGDSYNGGTGTTSNGWIQKVLKSFVRDTIIGFLLLTRPRVKQVIPTHPALAAARTFVLDDSVLAHIAVYPATRQCVRRSDHLAANNQCEKEASHSDHPLSQQVLFRWLLDQRLLQLDHLVVVPVNRLRVQPEVEEALLPFFRICCGRASFYRVPDVQKRVVGAARRFCRKHPQRPLPRLLTGCCAHGPASCGP